MPAVSRVTLLMIGEKSLISNDKGQFQRGSEKSDSEERGHHGVNCTPVTELPRPTPSITARAGSSWKPRLGDERQMIEEH